MTISGNDNELLNFATTEPMGAEAVIEAVRAAGQALGKQAAIAPRLDKLRELAPQWGHFEPGGLELQRIQAALLSMGVPSGQVKTVLRWESKQAEEARAAAGRGESGVPVETARPEWEKQLKRDSRGGLVAHTANVVTILTHHELWMGVLGWDEFRQAIVCREAAPWHDDDCPEARPEDRDHDVFEDMAAQRLSNWVLREYGMSLSPEACYAAAKTVAMGRSRVFNSLRDWLAGLAWDRADRLGGPSANAAPSWLTTYLGVDDDVYTRCIGRWWLISAVARAFKPGCQVDHMLILEGDQSAGKSSALRRLFGDFMSETQLDLHSKDRFLALRGTWLQSFDELAGMSRSDENMVKGFITAVEDKYRPPYAATPVAIRRQCVFAGTTNPRGAYLKDETGNRRYWPVRCGKTIHIKRIAEDREQLWAQAVAAYRAGEKWHPETEAEKALCRAVQESRADLDVWYERVERFVSDKQRQASGPFRVSTEEILLNAIGLEPADLGKDRAPSRVAGIMTALGWKLERRQVDRNRDSGPRWWPPAALSPAEEVARLVRRIEHHKAEAAAEERRLGALLAANEEAARAYDGSGATALERAG